jgi:peptide methionine sulfoxide reductase MsrB
MSKQINPNLNDEQKDVLFNKATEAPFSGEYLNYQKDGTYLFARIALTLFLILIISLKPLRLA